MRMKPNEAPTNQTFTVASDSKDLVVSQVGKIWKTDPKYAPQQRSYSVGFALKLEFGSMTNGFIPGKIYLALPDTEQSVVAGLFNASYMTPDASAQAVQTQVPMANPAAGSARDQFNKRYGIRR